MRGNRISFERDSKLPNAGTFTIQREDHTIGNLLRMQLHQDHEVQFSGYKHPHPLDYHILVKVQTTNKSSPIMAMNGAIKDLTDEITSIRESFQAEVERVREMQVD